MPIPQYQKPVKFQIEAPRALHPIIKGTLTTLFRSVEFDSGRRISIISHDLAQGIFTAVKLEGSDYVWKYLDQEINSLCYNRNDREKRVKERIRLGITRVICLEYQIPFSPWGILVGVRPTKLVHRLIDRSFSLEQIKHILSDVYHVSPARQKLLIDVVLKQRDFFLSDVNNPISIYVGIPFCPTRCDYCSFAAYPLKTHGHLLPQFLQALKKELISLGKMLQELEVKVQSVYIGGGTPTTIRGEDLALLLMILNKYFSANECQEYTIEAGRPETITADILRMFKDNGVQRICINPQTMNDHTLRLIGRAHTAHHIREAFALTRKAGIPIINSDLILGLPGEDVNDFEYSLVELAKLRPDNITIHSLALKRASIFGQTPSELDIQQHQGKKMALLAKNYMEELGFEPYYLYRQRYTLGDLENIGYGRRGTESIYNIQMMEERQTIIGIGGGAMTKLVNNDLSLVRQANPKCPATYSNQIEQIIAAKKYQIRQHLSV
ncbi:MAG: coproporphyrinogen dehydrogenase HemZ [Firmicutes bacterium]|nr:coproporphyrinogen dehydrogenase HemZ [Bacillota bacterium]